MLDIGPVGNGLADDPLGLRYGLEQRVTEKRRALAVLHDSLGQYDGRLPSDEVKESAAVCASVAAGGGSGGGVVDTGGGGVDGGGDGGASVAGAAGPTKAEMEARLRQERNDLMLTLRKTDIATLQRESFGKTMQLIDRANQVDESKRSSKGEVPSSRLLEAEGALMEAIPGRRSSRGTLPETPSGYPPSGSQAAAVPAASPTSFSNGTAPKRRSSKGSGSSKSLRRRSSRGALPEGTPPAGYPPDGQCGCCDPSGRGAAASTSPSHRAAPGRAVCSSHTLTGPPSSALLSPPPPPPRAASALAPSHRAEPGPRAEPRRSFSGSQRPAGALPPRPAGALPPSAVPSEVKVPSPDMKVAEGSWRELCTSDRICTSESSPTNDSTAQAKMGRSLSVMAAASLQLRSPSTSKIAEPSAVPNAVPSAVPAVKQGTSGRLRAAEAATRLSGGGGGGGGGLAGAAGALQVQAVAQTVGPGSLAAAVCYTNAGLLHRVSQGGSGASEAAAMMAAAAAAKQGVPGLRRQFSGGAQAVADQAGRRKPMKGVPRSEEDHALCVAAAHALLGLRSPRGVKAVPVLRTSSEHSSQHATREPPSLASAQKVNRNSLAALPLGAPPALPAAPPAGLPPGMQLTAGGGNPNLTPTLFSAMSGGVPPPPPQPGQAMLSHIRKLNLGQDAQQPRPASVARALSRARGEMSEAERAARSSAVIAKSPPGMPPGSLDPTDPMLHAPPGSLQATLTRPAYSSQGSNLAIATVRLSPGAARDGGGTLAAAAETAEAVAAEAAAARAARAAAAGAARTAAAEAAKAEAAEAAAAEATVAAAAEAEAAAAAAEVEAEAAAAEAARLRDEANESLRELQAMEAEATKAEKLARAKGGSQKLGVGKAQRLADLSGAIARLEDAAAAAEVEAQAAQARVEVARAARRARAAEELSELSLCSPLQPSPYKYGGAPLAQPTRGGGGDETMQAQVRWLARGGSSGESCGSDEALSPDRSPYASHYASHCDPTSKPPPTPARRLSLSAFGQRLLQAPRVLRASSSPAAVPARDGLLARVASRLRRSSSQKEAPTRAAVPQRLASFDDEMRA